jgi:dihydrolipoamide dehydrogenase
MLTRITIVGSGPGGYVAAIRAAQRGARVTVVEDAEVGGTCLNWGCIPTKTLIASTDALKLARHAADFGVELSGEVTYNLQKIRERRDKVVSTQVKGIRALFKSWGVDLIPGRGSLISEDVVRAVRKDGTTQDIRSDRIIIATGSRPAAIPGLPFDGNSILSSNDAVLMHEVPASILIVGAGIIGCEFAFLYRSLGSSVTVVEMLPRALSSEDEDISSLIEKELKKAKIKLITGARIESMKGTAEGVTAVLSNGQEVQAAKALVSIGRALNTEGLRLEDAGLAAGKRGEVPVNDRMETTVPGIYAIGDVTGIMMLAHVASRQGIVAAENALGGDVRMDYAAVPAGIFTRPEIGSAGLREHQARERGTKISTGTFPYRALGKAHAMGEIAGIVKIIADAVTDRVLGVHICGAHAADLVHEGALAITMGATSKQLGAMIHAHPTLAEGIMEAAEAVHGSAIHLPREGK